MTDSATVDAEPVTSPVAEDGGASTISRRPSSPLVRSLGDRIMVDLWDREGRQLAAVAVLATLGYTGSEIAERLGLAPAAVGAARKRLKAVVPAVAEDAPRDSDEA